MNRQTGVKTKREREREERNLKT
jgi:hypothetical protein